MLTQSHSTTPSHQVAPSNDRSTMIQINVGEYGLGIRAEHMLAVYDSSEVVDLASPVQVMPTAGVATDLPGDASGTLVKCSHGTIPAIRMNTLLNVDAPANRQPLVLVRTGNENQPYMGLFVDSTSRPQTVANRDWVDVPDWVRAELTLPANSMVIERHVDQPSRVRLILSPNVFHSDDFQIDPLPERRGVSGLPESQQEPANKPKPTTAIRTNLPASSNATQQASAGTIGRGLLVFAPAESSRTRMRAAVAVPMSCVMGVDQRAELTKIPTNDFQLDGITVWNGITVPVLRLGDAIGMISEATSNQPKASDDETRLLIFRTPAGKVFGCFCHTQMRSLRTPTTTGLHPDCRMNEDLLHGAFLTEEGPLAVPHLDRLLHPQRLTVARAT